MTAPPRVTGFVVLVAFLAGGCGTSQHKEGKMTPDEARSRLSATIVEVLEAGVPGGAPELDSSGFNDGIPCGGLEGNEFTKIKHAIEGSTTRPAADPGVALRAMRKKLDDLGYDSAVDDFSDFKLIGFFNSNGSADIKVYPSGRVEVDAETECLDNPDR